MGPLSTALRAESLGVVAKISHMQGKHAEIVSAARGTSRALWWTRFAESLSRHKTLGFGVSGTGLQVVWRVRAAGGVTKVSVRLEEFTGPRRHHSMLEALIRKLDPPGGSEVYGLSFYSDSFTPVLLDFCDSSGATFLEDAFRAADAWAAEKDPGAKRSRINRDDAEFAVRKALKSFLGNGGDADDIRRIVDEEIVGTVLQS